MAISLVEVAGANFRTDEGSDETNTEFLKRLGVKARYMPARLAIARSLAISTPPTPLAEEMEWGKSIKGDTLFGTGTDLAAWVALITQRSEGNSQHLRDFISLVAAHWQRGLSLLQTDWEKSEQDVAHFVRRQVVAADLPHEVLGNSPSGGRAAALNGLVEVPIGEISKDAASGEDIVWAMNGQGGSPHAAIMGGVGSGKTRTAVALLRELRQKVDVPIIAFDFKGDLGTDSEGKGYKLDETFDARMFHPPRQPIPLNVLSLPSRESIDISFAAERFRESFGRLKGQKLGDRQRDAVYTAAERALRINQVCTLNDIRTELLDVYQEREMTEDGAISTFNDICRFPLFEATLSPSEFFSRGNIIRLSADVPETSRGIVVNLVLDALDQYLNSLPDAPTDSEGNRSFRILCVIDEAHRILGTKLPALANLIRMSRSKGGSVMLISQSPDDFSGEDDEFLNEMGLVAAFATNARPAAVSKILGKGASLAALQTGQCYAKRRGDSVARKLQSWKARG